MFIIYVILLLLFIADTMKDIQEIFAGDTRFIKCLGFAFDVMGILIFANALLASL